MKLNYYLPSETKYIVDNFRTMGYKQIANHLNRTPRAIQKTVERMKLAKNDSKNRGKTVRIF